MAQVIGPGGAVVDGVPGYKMMKNSEGVTGLQIPGKPNTWVPIDKSILNNKNNGNNPPARQENTPETNTPPTAEQRKNSNNPRYGDTFRNKPGKATSADKALVWDKEKEDWVPQTASDSKPEEDTDDDKPDTPKPTPTGRDSERNGAKGTQMSPSPAKPGDFDALARKIAAKNPGVRFNQDYQVTNENSGSLSTNLPVTAGTTPNPQRSEVVQSGNQAGKTVYSGREASLEDDGPTSFREFVIDGSGSREISKGAQKGSSSAPDVGETQTKVKSGLQEALDSVKAYKMSDYKGDKEDPTMKRLLAQSKNRDRRGEAFLDGNSNSMWALRAADLSQGIITAGSNEKFGRGEDGKMVKLNDKAVAALKANPNAVASQQFLSQYMGKAEKPSDQQSSDVTQPVPASSVEIGNLTREDVSGTKFFETDATKMQGLGNYTYNPTDTRSDFISRQDTSEPGRSWMMTGYEMEALNNREPYMRFNAFRD